MASPTDDTVAGAAPPTSNASHLDSTAQTVEKPVDITNGPVSPTSMNEEFKDALQQQNDQTPSAEVATPLPTTTTPAQSEPASMMPQLARKETEALGPATEAPIPIPTANATGSPTLSISLMLTTGARHPYKIDEKYLRNRKIEAINAQGTFDPREISGYQLKELVWTDWRNEWEPRPATPSSIRLIIMGRMIEDKTYLKDFPFNIEAVNVVHMTVKPADLIDDEETAGKSTGKGGILRTRDTEDRGAGCRCVIL